jgi:hypothetical protein
VSRFQGNSLIPDKGIGELSSFQTAKKVLWQMKQGGFNDNWDKISLRIAGASNCIAFAKYQSVPTSVMMDKTSKCLRETKANLW